MISKFISKFRFSSVSSPGSRAAKAAEILGVKSFANKYEEHHMRSTDERTVEDFWAEHVNMIDWFKKPDLILDRSNPPFYKWFKGGQLNVSYNCLDRHLKEIGNNVAFHYDSPITNQYKSFTYREVHDYVSKLSGALNNLGVKKGDRVVIYMPMIPEAIFSMLACARVGAIQTVVFGGFGGPELASRLKDFKPKLVLTASCGVEPHTIVDYKKNLDEAIGLSGIQGIKKLIVQRPQKTCNLIKGEDFEFYDELSKGKLTEAVPMDANDYLYLLYTSGTTGSPKGIIRDQVGTSMTMAYSMKHIMDVGKGETYFSTSDIGWIVGHNFIVYGPLTAGATTVLHEGKPVGTPDAAQIWRLTEKYKVKNIFSSPTAVRSIRKEDPEALLLKNFDLSSLKMICVGGERMDVPAYHWLRKGLSKDVIINDNYWQTETGWPISTNYLNLHTFAERPGSAGKPNIGNKIAVFNEDGKILGPGELGKVCIKLPMPPNFMSTVYNNDKAFKEKYLEEVPGYYLTGDAGYLDKDGYLHITTRIDDIINTAGHRLSTSQMEEVLTTHPDIVEAAVIGGRDEIKGEIPVGFVVLKKGSTVGAEKLEKECLKMVRYQIGPVAAFKYCMIVDKLPKTRSGKIVRNILKSLVNGETPKIPPTIEDASVVDVLSKAIKEHGLGKKVNIQFEEDV